jgi:serine protease Do
MTSPRLFLVLLLIGLAGAALVLAVTQPFTRRPPARPVTLPTVATSGLGSVAPPRRSEPVSGAIDAQTFRRIAEAQTPMVVNIRSEARRQAEAFGDFFGGDDPWRRFFGGPEMKPGPPRDEVLEGAGSGFIIDKSGLILTNNHVVARASRIEVGLFAQPGQNDRQTYQARVIGRDPLTDSALIRIAENGNPFNLTHTVTAGVIRAKGRPFPVEGRIQEMLQTDTATNPGNSGGPLLNLRGEVIGINTAILSTGPNGGNVGIGFAVPINVVNDLLPQLQEGQVTRGRIGVRVTNVPREAVDELGLSEQRGALVESVESKGPAARAGIGPGDVIVEYEGTPVRSSDELVRMVVNSRPGSRVSVKVVRDKQPMTFDVQVEPLEFADERPAGGTAFVLVARDGQQHFLTLTKPA